MNSLQISALLRPVVGLVLAFSLTLGSGCSLDNTPKAPEILGSEEEDILLQRVTERWQALEKKDFAATYKYTTPNYREVFSKALYINKFSYAVDWELTGVEVVNYDARAAVASVAVRVMSKPAKQTSVASNKLGALPLTMREKWIYVDGQWWNSARD